jgi:hypothetical protein
MPSHMDCGERRGSMIWNDGKVIDPNRREGGKIDGSRHAVMD